MELLLVIAVLAALAFAAGRAGFDSRPRIGDEPHRAI
jgi:hypothetical protein